VLLPTIVQADFTGWNGPDLCAGLDTYAHKLCNLLWDIQKILYAGALVLAIIMVIIGGITYMTAGESEDKAKKARKMITNGIIGFAIVIAFSFIIGIVREIITNSLLQV
jgi:preprotein translocase subunit YajC